MLKSQPQWCVTHLGLGKIQSYLKQDRENLGGGSQIHVCGRFIRQCL